MFDANKQIIEVSKNLGLGVGEAIMLNVQLNFLADTSNDLLVNQRSIRQALTELNTEYGTAVVFNDETLTTYSANPSDHQTITRTETTYQYD